MGDLPPLRRVYIAAGPLDQAYWVRVHREAVAYRAIFTGRDCHHYQIHTPPGGRTIAHYMGRCDTPARIPAVLFGGPVHGGECSVARTTLTGGLIARDLYTYIGDMQDGRAAFISSWAQLAQQLRDL